MRSDLRPARPGDVDYILDLERHAENAPWIGAWTRDRYVASLDDANWTHLIVEDAGQRVGFVNVKGLTDDDRVMSIERIAITEKGRGIGREVLRLVKKLAFEEHGAHRLWLDVLTHNERAIHLYEAAGFVREGTLRECERGVNGDYESLHIYSILENEYRESTK